MKVFQITTWKRGNRWVMRESERLWEEHSDFWNNRYIAQLYDFSTQNIERIVNQIVKAEQLIHCADVRFQRTTVCELYPGWQITVDSTFEVAAHNEVINYSDRNSFSSWKGQQTYGRYNSEVVVRAGFNRVTGRVAQNAYRGCLRPGALPDVEETELHTVPSDQFWAVRMPAFVEAMNAIPEICSDFTSDMLGQLVPVGLGLREWNVCGVSILNAAAKQLDYARTPKRLFLQALHESAAEAVYKFNYCWQRQKEFALFDTPFRSIDYWGEMTALANDYLDDFLALSSFARYAAESLEPYDKTVLNPSSEVTAKYSAFLSSPVSIALDFDAITPALQKLADLYDFLAWAKIFRFGYAPNYATENSLIVAKLNAYREVMRTLCLLELLIPQRLFRLGRLPKGTIQPHEAKGWGTYRFPDNSDWGTPSYRQVYLWHATWPDALHLLTQIEAHPYNWREPVPAPDPTLPVPLFWPGPTTGPDGVPIGPERVRKPEPPGNAPETPGNAPEPTGGPPEQPGPGPFNREQPGNDWGQDWRAIGRELIPEMNKLIDEELAKPIGTGIGEGGWMRPKEFFKPPEIVKPGEVGEATEFIRGFIGLAKDAFELTREIPKFIR